MKLTAAALTAAVLVTAAGAAIAAAAAVPVANEAQLHRVDKGGEAVAATACRHRNYSSSRSST